MNQERIGLFGGSFDPPHLGHEALVHAAIEMLGLDAVWVIPTGIPAHRNLSGHATAEQRLAWAAAMFADVPNVQIKDWEARQSRPVAAIDTLKQFCDDCPEVVPAWLCGVDSFASMPTWIDYPEHKHYCNVAVFSRAGEPRIKVTHGWTPITVEQWCLNHDRGDRIDAGHVVFLDGSLPDVSATAIRDRAQRGESLNGLVNSRICKEVEALYGPKSGV